jgi:malate/lactate dehydrogenase
VTTTAASKKLRGTSRDDIIDVSRAIIEDEVEQLMAGAVAQSGVTPAQSDTVTEVVWAMLHGLVTLSITRRLRPSRALQQARLEQLIAAIVAMTAQK